MKNPAGKGAWMTGVILSALTLLLALASILLNVLGFAVIAAQPTQPVQNWNQPQPGPVPARR